MSERIIEAETSTELKRLAVGLIDLAQPRLGSRMVFSTDDFFAPMDRLIDPAPPVFFPDRYDDHGKWMDGWETRRKRTAGYDHAVLSLGVLGRVRLLDIDTSHFTGNYAPAASIDACLSDAEHPGAEADWWELLPARSLAGDAHHVVELNDGPVLTHLRLNIYPDGGVARLRVYGEVHREWSAADADQTIDLAAQENGGRALTWSNAHYGDPNAILAPGRGLDMGDGWETARRREPGYEWIIIALGRPGRIERLLVDTLHNKGNFPDSCSINAALVTGGTLQSMVSQSMFWQQLLPDNKLTADSEHHFAAELADLGPVSHLRLNIYPDGGISRFRVFGYPDRDE